MNFFSGSKQKEKSFVSDGLYLKAPYVETYVVSGNMRKIVKLPRYVDLNEWLAAHVLDFSNFVSLFHGTVSEFCTASSCPTMQGAPGLEYQWNENSSRKPVNLTAHAYLEACFAWIQGNLENESIFPTKAGAEFPKDIDQTIKAIFKQLFRVFAHLYNFHYDQILHLQQEGHLNTLFAHFISFSNEFNLLEKKELEPLQDLIRDMQSQGVIAHPE